MRRTGPHLNLPNQLTFARIGLCVLFVISMSWDWPWAATSALAIFGLASLTDWADGWIARRYHLVTDLGKLLDPLADKILISAAFISLVERGLAPTWMVVVIIAREFLITGLRLVAANKQLVLAAEKVGKHKTVTQIIAILASLLWLSLRELGLGEHWGTHLLENAILPLYWLALLITVISGIMYFYKNRFLFAETASGESEASTSKPYPETHVAEPLPLFPAFKEWSSIVEALGQGAQTIILRKGGLREGKSGFQIEHPRFWLYPTQFHEEAAATKPGASSYLAVAARPVKPPAGKPASSTIEIRYFADLVDCFFVTAWEDVQKLDPLHLWTEATVRERFDWSKTDGIHLLVLRVYRLDHPFPLPDDPSYGGCKSWIQIPYDFNREKAKPVIPNEEFAVRRSRIPKPGKELHLKA
jgi:CDP-diacylglycerol--glycerol-3-phosphate 3-phosphatidyltransferase